MIFQRRAAITEEALTGLLEGGETDQAALVAAKTAAKALAETLAAMANANGGLVILGVSTRGHIQKDNDVDALRDLADQASLLTDGLQYRHSPD